MNSLTRVMISLYVVLFLLFKGAVEVVAFDDQITHPDITKNSVRVSNLKNYLINDLAIREGFEKDITYAGLVITTYSGLDEIQETVNRSHPIIDWLIDGSKTEDAPLCRASNHFHDPLKAWDQSYVTDYPIINTVCLTAPWSRRYSNVVWATGLLSPSSSQTQTFLNDTLASPPAPNTWTRARNYYYSAMTATTNTDRETNFAKTFQAVGQVMHLLQDMAVPAHVRNDFESHILIGQEKIS